MSNRDFKNSSRAGSRARAQTVSAKSSGKSGGGGGMMAGILVGLIVGVAVVVGAVMYFNRASTPFTNMQKLERRSGAASAGAAEVLAPEVGTRLTEQPKAAAVVPETPSAASSAAAPSKPAEAHKPEGKPQEAAKSEQQEFDFYKILPGKLEAVPGQEETAKPPTPSSSNKRIYLQVGAFQHENEADNLKAKLALLGVEAKIQSVNLPDKGLLHRVRIGPFSRAEELERTRTQLKQNGLDSAVVKANNS